MPSKQELDDKRCQKYIKSLISPHSSSNSPLILFMLKELEKAGCPFSTDLIQCQPCEGTNGIAGGYDPIKGVRLGKETIY